VKEEVRIGTLIRKLRAARCELANLMREANRLSEEELEQYFHAVYCSACERKGYVYCNFVCSRMAYICDQLCLDR